MQRQSIEIRPRGQDVRVPAAEINGRTVFVTGRFIKTAAVHDEELVEGEIVPDPPAFIRQLAASGLKADIFTFPQRFDDTEPRHPYTFEWDNAAAVPTTSVGDWWSRIKVDARQNARKAAKRGVTIREVEFNDEFVAQIKGIYDETPLRQGRRFWHYGKSIDQIRKENATYLERSVFIGAYFNDELIGFFKFVCVDDVAVVLQILSKQSHYDKKPTNALIAKGVEVCHARGIKYLQYTKFTFGNKIQSQLAEFKRRNGFEQLNYPRYYVPLTLKGRVIVKFRLYRGILQILPPRAIDVLLRVRQETLRLLHGVGQKRGIQS